MTAEEYDLIVQGKWRPDLPRPWAFHATKLLSRTFSDILDSLASISEEDSSAERSDLKEPYFTDGQLLLIQDIAEYAQRRSLPVLVVEIPSIERLMGDSPPSPDIVEFAHLIGADYIDGVNAFENLTLQETRALWMPFDGHWGQGGSNRFADWFFHVLSRWMSEGSER